MQVYAPYLINLLDYAAYQQVESSVLKDVLTHHDIDIDNLDEMVSAEGYLDVFARIIQKTENDYTGLYFGTYQNMGALGLVKEISLHTSSIEQGVLILQNFLDSKFPIVSVKPSQDSNSYSLHLYSSIENAMLKRHILDMVTGIVYRELKLMLPPVFNPKIVLPYSNDKPYNNALETTVTKHQEYQLVLPIDVINAEINQNKIKEIELLLPKYIAMLSESQYDSKEFSSQIWKMTLNMCAPEIPNFEQVQKQFPYSKRTIQRKLMSEGRSFRTIANAIKKELSNYLLNEKHLKTMDVAHILGYSESSAYLHAVKSWRR
ncbi:hypothetical protein GTQ34_09610 [Muricauda sp. JGD-17]|uniref:AraC family transcriptional regulator n=1 Tax=Flagellimonas ochracea TaxID=2696472 RepID=A0A964TC75_9FLAO|nr:hypothetical protein [Allomuricauda ochracea]NAY92175.1 hypothetical protein [Allomuricauda ochracea]